MCTPSFMQRSFQGEGIRLGAATLTPYSWPTGSALRERGTLPMRTRRSPIDELRLAIDCLPVRTRTAMLEGVRANDIIVGAYADREGGVCPMLAAHRRGGRTNFISFAKAWDA